MLYSFISLALATAVLALPHNLPEASSSTSTATTPCSGAPAIPFGAVAGDLCGGTLPPTSPVASPVPREVVPRVRKKRDGFSTCQIVTMDQYKASPFKDAIEALAKKNWGKDNHATVKVNPSEFPDRPLHFCYSTDTVQATFNGDPICSTSQSQISGTVANGTADVTISINQGVTSTHTVTTEKAASLATATEIGITFGVPEIEQTSVSETVTLTGTFTKGDTETTALNQQTIETVVAHATKPGPCNIELNVTSCTASASVTIPAFYIGFVWFTYGHKIDGHFDWALEVDVVIPAEQRSDNMTLTDKIASTNSGHFTSECC